MLSNYMWCEALSLHFARLAKRCKSRNAGGDGRSQHPARGRAAGSHICRTASRNRRLCARRGRLSRRRSGAAVLGLRQVAWRSFGESEPCRPRLPAFRRRRRNPEEWDRHKEVDEIPSPWLTGIQDEFFDGKLAPLIIETNRGCPFTCTFCCQGTRWYTKVHNFSRERHARRDSVHRADGSVKLSPQRWARCASPIRTTACSSVTSKSPATSARCRNTTAGRLYRRHHRQESSGPDHQVGREGERRAGALPGRAIAG